MRTKLVLGNWKMNGDVASAEALLAAVREGAATLSGARSACARPIRTSASRPRGWRVRRSAGARRTSASTTTAPTPAACPPACSPTSAARTRWVGHSERARCSATPTRRSPARLRVRSRPGWCRWSASARPARSAESGATEAVLARQVDAVCATLKGAGERCVLAYEPVWAIGTGLTATPQQAQDAHAFIRARLAAGGVAAAPRLQLLYGGSVKPANAAELFSRPDVDGGLIGGASLVAGISWRSCAPPRTRRAGPDRLRSTTAARATSRGRLKDGTDGDSRNPSRWWSRCSARSA